MLQNLKARSYRRSESVKLRSTESTPNESMRTTLSTWSVTSLRNWHDAAWTTKTKTVQAVLTHPWNLKPSPSALHPPPCPPHAPPMPPPCPPPPPTSIKNLNPKPGQGDHGLLGPVKPSRREPGGLSLKQLVNDGLGFWLVASCRPVFIRLRLKHCYGFSCHP